MFRTQTNIEFPIFFSGLVRDIEDMHKFSGSDKIASRQRNEKMPNRSQF